MNEGPGMGRGDRDTIEQVPGPAAWLCPAPWRLTPNAALGELISPGQCSEAVFCGAFEGPRGDLLARIALGRPFQGRLHLGTAHAAGNGRLLHLTCAPCEGGEGWLCTFVDISPVERRRSGRALTLARLRHNLDQLQDLISMVTQGETLLYANAAYATYYATTTAKVPGKKLRDVMGPNYFLTAPFRQQLFQTLRPIDYERLIPDMSGRDRVLSIMLRPLLDTGTGAPVMGTLARDVTLRHQGMEALRQTLERLDALFEAGIEGILLCDGSVITDANPVACRLIGQDREVLVGQPLATALELLGAPPLDGGSDEHGMADLYLSLRPGADGRPPLQIRSIALQDEAPRFHAVLLQDMSYRHQSQRRIDSLVADLRQQTTRAEAADRSKSVFLASASHDLRQPIHSLGLFLTTIQSMARSPHPLHSEPLRPIVQRMRASLDGLMQLLDMLLGASLRSTSQQALERRATPLQPLLDELVTEFAPTASGKGLMLRTVPSRAWVMTDATVLRRILRNLVSNAVRYTRQGRIAVGARRRGPHVELQVWDTGVGIGSEQLDAIFDEFYRVDLRAPQSERAEGLGLSIVKRAAAELDARLDVRSTRGRGSMFSVLLPSTQAAAADAPGPPALPPLTPATRKCILLIDDDRVVLEATAQLLESWGHHVLGATDAAEAMQLCAAQPHPIDAVICDYMLDPAMDGLDLLLRLREQHPGPLPVCMVTGDMSARCIDLARRHGFALLHKPVSAQALQRFLETGESGVV